MRTKKISKQKSKVRIKKPTNLLQKELSNVAESSEKNLNSTKAYYKEKESINKKKELIRIMNVICKSVKDLEIDIMRAVKILKELTNVEKSDIQNNENKKDLLKDLDDGLNDLEFDIKDDILKIDETSIEEVALNLNTEGVDTQNAIVTFSGDSYSIKTLIDKLKDKYKGPFSASMARSGMFTSKKRPNKEEWTDFLDSLVDQNVLNRLPEGNNKGPVRYKF